MVLNRLLSGSNNEVLTGFINTNLSILGFSQLLDNIRKDYRYPQMDMYNVASYFMNHNEVNPETNTDNNYWNASLLPSNRPDLLNYPYNNDNFSLIEKTTNDKRHVTLANIFSVPYYYSSIGLRIEKYDDSLICEYYNFNDITYYDILYLANVNDLTSDNTHYAYLLNKYYYNKNLSLDYFFNKYNYVSLPIYPDKYIHNNDISIRHPYLFQLNHFNNFYKEYYAAGNWNSIFEDSNQNTDVPKGVILVNIHESQHKNYLHVNPYSDIELFAPEIAYKNTDNKSYMFVKPKESFENLLNLGYFKTGDLYFPFENVKYNEDIFIIQNNNNSQSFISLADSANVSYQYYTKIFKDLESLILLKAERVLSNKNFYATSYLSNSKYINEIEHVSPKKNNSDDDEYTKSIIRIKIINQSAEDGYRSDSDLNNDHAFSNYNFYELSANLQRKVIEEYSTDGYADYMYVGTYNINDESYYIWEYVSSTSNYILIDNIDDTEPYQHDEWCHKYILTNRYSYYGADYKNYKQISYVSTHLLNDSNDVYFEHIDNNEHEVRTMYVYEYIRPLVRQWNDSLVMPFFINNSSLNYIIISPHIFKSTNYPKTSGDYDNILSQNKFVYHVNLETNETLLGFGTNINIPNLHKYVYIFDNSILEKNINTLQRFSYNNKTFFSDGENKYYPILTYNGYANYLIRLDATAGRINNINENACLRLPESFNIGNVLNESPYFDKISKDYDLKDWYNLWIYNSYRTPSPRWGLGNDTIYYVSTTFLSRTDHMIGNNYSNTIDKLYENYSLKEIINLAYDVKKIEYFFNGVNLEGTINTTWNAFFGEYSEDAKTNPSDFINTYFCILNPFLSYDNPINFNYGIIYHIDNIQVDTQKATANVSFVCMTLLNEDEIQFKRSLYDMWVYNNKYNDYIWYGTYIFNGMPIVIDKVWGTNINYIFAKKVNAESSDKIINSIVNNNESYIYMNRFEPVKEGTNSIQTIYQADYMYDNYNPYNDIKYRNYSIYDYNNGDYTESDININPINFYIVRNNSLNPIEKKYIIECESADDYISFENDYFTCNTNEIIDNYDDEENIYTKILTLKTDWVSILKYGNNYPTISNNAPENDDHNLIDYTVEYETDSTSSVLTLTIILKNNFKYGSIMTHYNSEGTPLNETVLLTNIDLLLLSNNITLYTDGVVKMLHIRFPDCNVYYDEINSNIITHKYKFVVTGVNSSDLNGRDSMICDLWICFYYMTNLTDTQKMDISTQQNPSITFTGLYLKREISFIPYDHILTIKGISYTGNTANEKYLEILELKNGIYESTIINNNQNTNNGYAIKLYDILSKTRKDKLKINLKNYNNFSFLIDRTDSSLGIKYKYIINDPIRTTSNNKTNSTYSLSKYYIDNIDHSYEISYTSPVFFTASVINTSFENLQNFLNNSYLPNLYSNVKYSFIVDNDIIYSVADVTLYSTHNVNCEAQYFIDFVTGTSSSNSVLGTLTGNIFANYTKTNVQNYNANIQTATISNCFRYVEGNTTYSTRITQTNYDKLDFINPVLYIDDFDIDDERSIEAILTEYSHDEYNIYNDLNAYILYSNDPIILNNKTYYIWIMKYISDNMHKNDGTYNGEGGNLNVKYLLTDTKNYYDLYESSIMSDIIGNEGDMNAVVNDMLDGSGTGQTHIFGLYPDLSNNANAYMTTDLGLYLFDVGKYTNSSYNNNGKHGGSLSFKIYNKNFNNIAMLQSSDYFKFILSYELPFNNTQKCCRGVLINLPPSPQYQYLVTINAYINNSSKFRKTLVFSNVPLDDFNKLMYSDINLSRTYYVPENENARILTLVRHDYINNSFKINYTCSLSQQTKFYELPQLLLSNSYPLNPSINDLFIVTNNDTLSLNPNTTILYWGNVISKYENGEVLLKYNYNSNYDKFIEKNYVGCTVRFEDSATGLNKDTQDIYIIFNKPITTKHLNNNSIIKYRFTLELIERQRKTGFGALVGIPQNYYNGITLIDEQSLIYKIDFTTAGRNYLEPSTYNYYAHINVQEKINNTWTNIATNLRVLLNIRIYSK